MRRIDGEWRNDIDSWKKCKRRSNNSPLVIQAVQNEDQLSQLMVLPTTAVCPDVWAEETNLLNCKNVWWDYSSTDDLSAKYYEENVDVVERAFAMGGIRLAAVLNYLFD